MRIFGCRIVTSELGSLGSSWMPSGGASVDGSNDRADDYADGSTSPAAALSSTFRSGINTSFARRCLPPMGFSLSLSLPLARKLTLYLRLIGRSPTLRSASSS